MMRRIAPLLLVAVTFGTNALGAQASSVPRDSAAFAGAAVLRVGGGLTRADVIGDGSPGIILVAVRENFNAHGYHAIAVAVQPRASLGAQPADSDWKLVTVTGGTRGVGDVLGTEEGADCTLRDFRFIRTAPGRGLGLLVAQRALGPSSYADPGDVEFTVYELRHNADGTPGWPAYYFEPVRSIHPTHRYCDVNAAFARELGLGSIGVAPAEGAMLGR